MQIPRTLTSVLAGVISVSAATAGVKITQDTLGPDGQIFAGSVSPKGGHIAVLAAKGSHYAVIVDGAEGPKIDALIYSISGDPYRPAAYWGNAPIPVLFSKDGAHWAYMAKVGDEFVVMRDGQEFARGPIKPRNLNNILNLTFSANGQHLFWCDFVGDKYVIVADGKAGPPMRYFPQVVLTADGDHYAYVNNDPRGTGAWAVVDGRQVNYFGDNLEYTVRDALLSTANADGASIFVINGKPAIKAFSFGQRWISADGRQIALVITPANGAPTLLTVNGKQIPGTEGLVIQKVYFSPDGKRYAALCVTKTGAKFMLVDGKKGDEYPDVPQQDLNDGGPHWRYVTWTANKNDFDELNPPLPGFTVDSSKFVYVANSNGRNFLVVDGEESNPFDSLAPVVSPVGNRVAAVGTLRDNTQHVLVDGKDTAYGPSPGGRQISQLTFSPHGTHYAFVQGFTLYLDGVAQPGQFQGNYVFSPDDQHLAYESNANGQQSLVVDGKVINDKAGMVKHIFFSPDSRHVYWVNAGNLPVTQGIQTRDSMMLFVDGRPAMHYGDNGTQMDPMTDTTETLHTEFSADDVMSFIAREDGNLRRFHITSDTDLATVLAAAPAAKGS